MEMQMSCETVYLAVEALHSNNRENSARANVWLAEFQKSVHAWQICDEILRGQKNEMASYFAAQTMRTKIQCSFYELPEESYQSLRDSLLQHLESVGASEGLETNVITMQLCLALVDLYLQVPSWSGFLTQLLQKFSSRDDLLLLLLKVLPEENDSRHLRLGSNRRESVGLELAEHTDQVVAYLWQVCSGSSESIVCRVFSCMSSWLLNPLVNTQNVAKSQLLHAVLQALANPGTSPKLHDTATDCIVQALYLAEDISKHGDLARALFTGIHAMQSTFQLCVANEYDDKLSNLSRIFTELGESLLVCMVENPGEGLGDLKTMDLLLLAVGHHDYALAEMTFNVWYRLSELLYQKDVDVVTHVFQPYITRLIMALHRHTAFDTDYEGIPVDHADMTDFRFKVNEVMKDTIFIPGSTTIFKQLMGLLEADASEKSWDFTESTLFIMSCIARNILPDEDEVVPKVVEAIINLPDNAHVALKFTAIRLIGELNEWMDSNSHYIEQTLIWLGKCVDQQNLADVTTETVEALCGSCTPRMVPHLGGLQQLVSHVQEMKNVSENSIVALLRAVATIISKLPEEDMQDKVVYICKTHADSLARLVDNACNGTSNGSPVSVDPVVPLDRLAAIFRQLPPPKNGQCRPWLPVVQQLWPILSGVCTKYETNVRTVEHCCRTIRFAIRSLGANSLPLIEPLVNQMVDIYARHQHSCFLYLASILVDEFGANELFQTGLLCMLEALCAPTFQMLEHDTNGYKNHPDTVDDFFRLTLRFVQRCPLTFFGSSSVKSILTHTVLALNLDHWEAHCSVAKFIVECFDFLVYSRKKEISYENVQIANTIMCQSGPAIVEKSINAMLFTLPVTFDKHISDILMAINHFDTSLLALWLRSCLENLPHSSGLSASLDQLQTFHRNVLNAQTMRQVTEALRVLIRLYR